MRRSLVLLSLTLAGCGITQLGSGRVDRSLAALVPADTTVLAGVRMDELRATPWYKKSVGDKPLPELDSFVKETGLDPRKDISELLIVSDGAKTAVLARGEFSRQNLQASINRQGGKRIPYKGFTLMGSEETVVVFLNSTTAAAGQPAAVRSIIDQRGRSTGLSPLLRQKVEAIPPHHQIWIVATGGFGDISKTVPQSGNFANLGKVFSMIESLTAGVDLRSGLHLFATGVCRSDQDARSLGDAVRGLVALARLAAPSGDPDLLKAIDGIQVEQQQRTVRLTVAIPQDLWDKTVGKLRNR
ncbi:MAG: hypothetical protein ABSH05_15700 [Bryobacteraceae bacterium]|jgi:hypothetical protein